MSNFLKEMAACFRAENRSCAIQTADVLASFSNVEFPHFSPNADTAAITGLLRSSPLAVSRAALDAQEWISWGHNPVASQVSTEVDALYSVVDLLGPTAPLYSPDLRAGLYYQRPNTRLGLHSHAAVETYVIIAGRALWTAGDAQRELGAGDAVHHKTYLPHACQTGDEGVVALWRWSGDIGIESYRMHDGSDAFAA